MSRSSGQFGNGGPGKSGPGKGGRGKDGRERAPTGHDPFEQDPFASVPDVDERLADWVDDTMSPRDRERFEAEMRVSPHLREQVRDYEDTVASIRDALNDETHETNLADRVMASLAQEATGGAAKQRRRGWPLVWGVMSAAALLGVAVMIDAWGSTMLAPKTEAGAALDSSRVVPEPSAGGETLEEGDDQHRELEERVASSSKDDPSKAEGGNKDQQGAKVEVIGDLATGEEGDAIAGKAAEGKAIGRKPAGGVDPESANQTKLAKKKQPREKLENERSAVLPERKAEVVLERGHTAEGGTAGGGRAAPKSKAAVGSPTAGQPSLRSSAGPVTGGPAAPSAPAPSGPAPSAPAPSGPATGGPAGPTTGGPTTGGPGAGHPGFGAPAGPAGPTAGGPGAGGPGTVRRGSRSRGGRVPSTKQRRRQPTAGRPATPAPVEAAPEESSKPRSYRGPGDVRPPDAVSPGLAGGRGRVAPETGERSADRKHRKELVDKSDVPSLELQQPPPVARFLLHLSDEDSGGELLPLVTVDGLAVLYDYAKEAEKVRGDRGRKDGRAVTGSDDFYLGSTRTAQAPLLRKFFDEQMRPAPDASDLLREQAKTDFARLQAQHSNSRMVGGLQLHAIGPVVTPPKQVVEAPAAGGGASNEATRPEQSQGAGKAVTPGEWAAKGGARTQRDWLVVGPRSEVAKLLVALRQYSDDVNTRQYRNGEVRLAPPQVDKSGRADAGDAKSRQGRKDLWAGPVGSGPVGTGPVGTGPVGTGSVGTGPGGTGRAARSSQPSSTKPAPGKPDPAGVNKPSPAAKPEPIQRVVIRFRSRR